MISGMNTEQTYDQLAAHVRETSLLEATSALLQWDERTGLPAQAGAYRAQQITQLSGMIHRRKTDPHFGEYLQTLSRGTAGSDPQTPLGASVARLLKDFHRNSLLPVDLVEAISTATVLGQQAWEKARAADNWSMFKPHLAQIFGLRRQEAEILQGEGSLYDALLDQYEEGAQSAALTQVFASLRDELVQLVQDLRGSAKPPQGSAWQRAVPIPQQRQISHWIAGRIGYDFQRGRLDETSHPFCTTLGPNDSRILTRYQASYFPSAFYSTLHEAGHGLYEQGLPTKWYGFPAGSYASLGVHESQSRLWENFIGRSQEFWEWCFPEVLQRTDAWEDLDAHTVYRDANRIEASLIRVEADEVTYNLHILIRFEIEQALLSGELPVDDAPAAWNERYQHYLGIKPPTHADGILQDVHWSAGLIGYFPTYTLGNVYAAQLMEAMTVDLGDTAALLKRGEFEPLLTWLRKKIHAHGGCLHPVQLIEQATGQSLQSKPLVQYLRNKLTRVYEL